MNIDEIKKKKSSKLINNHLYDVQLVGIQVIKKYDLIIENYVYQSYISLFLDDSVTDGEKIINLVTEIYNECPHCCAKNTVILISQIYPSISGIIPVLDEEYKIIDQYDTAELLDELEQQEDELMGEYPLEENNSELNKRKLH